MDDAHLAGNAALIAGLKDENQRLREAIYEYIQTTDQRGPKEILIENFMNGYGRRGGE